MTTLTYLSWHNFKNKVEKRNGIIVLLDGEPQNFVVEADDELGYVIKYADPVVVVNDRALWHKLFGRVEFKLGNR